MDDSALELYFLGLVFKEKIVGNIAIELDFYIRIVDIDSAHQMALCVAAIQMDTMIGIAVVIEMTDGTIGRYIGILLIVPLSAQGDIGGYLAKMLIVEQLANV